LNKVPKRSVVLNSLALPEEINMESYKENLSTGAFSIKYHDILNVQVARPSSAKLIEVADLIRDTKNISPNDNIFIFSSDPDYNLFANQENETLAIQTKNMQLINDTRLHFDNILQQSLHDPKALKTCASSDDITFIRKLIYKFKKIIEDLNTINPNENKIAAENKGINTRLSNTKIKSILYMRNVQNKTFKQIAQIIGTSRFTVSRIVKQCENKPSYECIKNKQPPRNLKISPQICNAIRLFVKMHRGLVTTRKISDFIFDQFRVIVSKTAICYTLKTKLNFRKRIGSTYVPWLNSIRFKFCRYYFVFRYLDLIRQGFIPASTDECGLQRSEFEKYVWVERGSFNPRSHPLTNKQWNLMLGISLDGIKTVEFHLGPTNQVSFLIFLNEFLYRLKEKEKNTSLRHFIILDNLGLHKTILVKSLSTKYGIPFLFIPTYSSLLNPVEYLFHYIKTSLSYSSTLTWYFDYYKNT